MTPYRYEENPLITPEDVKPYHENFEVIGAFNAGIAEFKDEVIMLLRVAERPISGEHDVIKAPIYHPDKKELEVKELYRTDERYDFSDPRVIRKSGSEQFAYLTSLSYLRIARSKDGRNFTVDPEPFIYPSTAHEIFGLEDPRITQIGEEYYIYFTAVSPMGAGEAMVRTSDFINVEHLGMIFAPENKDVAIFPEKINGKYYALHRPVPKSNGYPEVWLAESDNLLYWGNHHHLFGLRENHWDNARIGGGAVPIKTEQGWLALYHGASDDNRYCMGGVLLDLNDPKKVIARSEKPILSPEADYEQHGFFGNVVFSCGAISHGDTIKMYYGAADTSMACAEISLREVLESLKL
ncbi:glycoside hydrolase family 130 protein [Metabacillus sp. GX 13764]|uniref:BtaManbiosPhlase n=1 Tax=Metabacillus kandeliae TaxID=2900151 RepID=UPI001E3F9DDB|nr:glycoside hydrolase family 130 protein [Metabacillus kandeliae]MCD7034513.1 glycoside hydrolase family 130 protein [Metabacillus kandeliae]